MKSSRLAYSIAAAIALSLIGPHIAVATSTYMVDDGTAEDSIGLTAGGSFTALNGFAVTGGNNLITDIAIAWGTPAFPDSSLDGLAYTAVLWSDPNGDGSPTDAVVLATAPGVIAFQGTDTFLTSIISPTVVLTPNFFVGFVITHSAGQFPAAFDETPPTLPNTSWIAQTGNINDLSGASPVEQAGFSGNWLIRADAIAAAPEGGVSTPEGGSTLVFLSVGLLAVGGFRRMLGFGAAMPAGKH